LFENGGVPLGVELHDEQEKGLHASAAAPLSFVLNDDCRPVAERTAAGRYH
jgi:hypothetical protein